MFWFFPSPEIYKIFFQCNKLSEMSDTSRYHLVPRISEYDSDVESSPHEQLLPGTSIARRAVTPTWVVNLDPVLVLRVVNTILAIIIFVFWCIDGEGPFIAACIFTMFMLVFPCCNLFDL